jgi:hypothetical protein
MIWLLTHPLPARCVYFLTYGWGGWVNLLNNGAANKKIFKKVKCCQQLAAHPLISRPSLNNWAGVSGKEIDLIQHGGWIQRQTDIDHHSPRPISIICHFPDPPSFSLPTTFKFCYCKQEIVRVRTVHSTVCINRLCLKQLKQNLRIIVNAKIRNYDYVHIIDRSGRIYPHAIPCITQREKQD